MLREHADDLPDRLALLNLRGLTPWRAWQAGYWLLEEALWAPASHSAIFQPEDALRFADSTNEVRLNIKLHGRESKDKDLTKDIEHLEIV